METQMKMEEMSHLEFGGKKEWGFQMYIFSSRR